MSPKLKTRIIEAYFLFLGAIGVFLIVIWSNYLVNRFSVSVPRGVVISSIILGFIVLTIFLIVRRNHGNIVMKDKGVNYIGVYIAGIVLGFTSFYLFKISNYNWFLEELFLSIRPQTIGSFLIYFISLFFIDFIGLKKRNLKLFSYAFGYAAGSLSLYYIFYQHDILLFQTLLVWILISVSLVLIMRWIKYFSRIVSVQKVRQVNPIQK